MRPGDNSANPTVRLTYTEYNAGAQSPFRVKREPVSYTHLRAHETVLDLVCRLLLDKTNYYSTIADTLTNIIKPTYTDI